MSRPEMIALAIFPPPMKKTCFFDIEKYQPKSTVHNRDNWIWRKEFEGTGICAWSGDWCQVVNSAFKLTKLRNSSLLCFSLGITPSSILAQWSDTIAFFHDPCVTDAMQNQRGGVPRCSCFFTSVQCSPPPFLRHESTGTFALRSVNVISILLVCDIDPLRCIFASSDSRPPFWSCSRAATNNRYLSLKRLLLPSNRSRPETRIPPSNPHITSLRPLLTPRKSVCLHRRNFLSHLARHGQFSTDLFYTGTFRDIAKNVRWRTQP